MSEGREERGIEGYLAAFEFCPCAGFARGGDCGVDPADGDGVLLFVGEDCGEGGYDLLMELLVSWLNRG